MWGPGMAHGIKTRNGTLNLYVSELGIYVGGSLDMGRVTNGYLLYREGVSRDGTEYRDSEIVSLRYGINAGFV